MRLGIDIGGTKTDAVVLDDAGDSCGRTRLETGYGPEGVIATTMAAIDRVRALPGLADARIDTVGVGVPGMVDADRGHVRHAVNLGVDALDLGAELEARIGVPVRVENDVKAAALGACRLLGLGSSAAYLNLGTGLAVGFVLDGALWRGTRGAAGEIGHIPVDPLGALCPCGQRGCLETLASGSAIAAQWPSDDPHPARALFAAADAGDVQAEAVRLRFVRGIAAAVRVLVLTCDVENVVIGGGLSRLGPPLLDGVVGVLGEWANASGFLRSLALADRIRLLPDRLPAAAVGAALVGTARGALEPLD